MSDSAIHPREFDISKLNYNNEVKVHDNKVNKTVYISHKSKSLMIQTPECYSPFGLSCFNSEDGKTQSYS